MITPELVNKVAEYKKKNPPSRPFVCKYCNKGFAKETTVVAHMCETKRRWMQEKDIPVQLALQAFNLFYQFSMGSKTKSYTDFVKSQYYNAFVKFGYYCNNTRVVNFRRFVEYLLKNQIKLDHWTHELHYANYLRSYLKLEHVNDALERTIKTMTEWSEEVEKPFNLYFVSASSNRVVRDVCNGRISPWCIYNSSTGVDFLASCNQEQVAMMFDLIDPDFWQLHFRKAPSDQEFVKSVLTAAGV